MKTCWQHAVKRVEFFGATVIGLFCLGAAGARAAKLVAPPAFKAAPSPPSALASAGTASGDEDIRDIRPPFHIPYGWLWPACIGGGLLAASLAYGGWRWGSRHREQRGRLPYEIALEQLEAARHWMRTDQARAFSIAVSEVVRGYIERRFAMRASRLTTWEFLSDLAARVDSPLAGYRSLLGEFLYHCDLAKFARWRLSMPEMEAMLQSACRFVYETGQPAKSLENPPAQTVGAPSLPALGSARLDAPVSFSTASAPGETREPVASDRSRL